MCCWNPIILVLCNFVCLSFTTLRPVTIVISFDGFHYKYLDRNITPNILRLKKEGVSAPYMINIFPTKTFPNHFSIVTGQYAEEHNVLDNAVYDPILNKVVRYSEDLFTKGVSTVPIWIVNEEAGNNRYSGVMMWPGSDFKYNKRLPTHLEVFKYGYDFNKRVDTAMQWITNSTAPANLVFLYFEKPDSTGHAFGPESSEVDDALREVDNTLGYLESCLEKNKIQSYNLIILSDHGMAPVRVENMINLTQMLTDDTYTFDTLSPSLGISSKKGYDREVIEKLKAAASKKDSNFDFYEKHEIPEEWRYKNSFRTPPNLLVARNGYVFNDEYKEFEKFASYSKRKITPLTIFGVHGFDPSDSNMRPIFIANGPSFKKNHVAQTFKIVDLFSLFAHLVGANIDSYSQSGDFRRVKDLLASEVVTSNGATPKISNTNFITLATSLSIACLLIIIIFLLYVHYFKSKPSESIKWITPEPRDHNFYKVGYTALENCHLLTVLSESDEAT